MSLDLRQIAERAAHLGIAFAQAGVFETAPNRGPQIEFWQKAAGGAAGESWCCDFAFNMYLKSYCTIKGYLTGKTDAENRAILLNHADEMSKRTGIARTGSCAASLAHADVMGRKHGRTFVPSVGDQIFYDFPVNGKQLGRAHHTGIVLAVIGDGRIRVVEGNTVSGDAGNQSEGQGVYVRTRATDYVVGYAHLDGLI